MADKKPPTKAVKKALKKEVNLPIPMPKNKFGEALVAKRRIPLTKYFGESWKELKKVTWPNRRETLKLTMAVIIFTTVFTIFMSIADFGIGQVVERILL